MSSPTSPLAPLHAERAGKVRRVLGWLSAALVLLAAAAPSAWFTVQATVLAAHLQPQAEAAPSSDRP